MCTDLLRAALGAAYGMQIQRSIPCTLCANWMRVKSMHVAFHAHGSRIMPLTRPSLHPVSPFVASLTTYLGIYSSSPSPVLPSFSPSLSSWIMTVSSHGFFPLAVADIDAICDSTARGRFGECTKSSGSSEAPTVQTSAFVLVKMGAM